MNKRIPTLLTSALLALPGGALLAAGQVAQQTPSFEFNKELVSTIVNFVGALLLLGLPVLTQQLLRLRNEVKVAQADVKETKKASISTEEMERVNSRMGTLENTLQMLRDDLRVTTSERDTARREIVQYKADNAVLIEQLEDERKITAALSKRCDEQDTKIAELERRMAINEGINELASKLMEGIKELVKAKTGEHQIINAGELKPAT